MKGLFTAIALLVGLTGFNFALPAAAEDRLITDVGTLDKELGRKGIPRQASLLSLRWTQFPDASSFR